MIYGYENVCYYCESIFSQSVKCENKTFHKNKNAYKNVVDVIHYMVIAWLKDIVCKDFKTLTIAGGR